MHNIARGILENLARPPIVREGDFHKDGILMCGKCGEPRQAWVDWFPDENGDIKQRLVPVMCNCDVLAEEREKKRRRQADFDEAMRNVQTVLHTTRDDMCWTFDMDTDKDSKISKICRKYVDQWEEMKRDNMGIMFYGNIGIGKSFYASCICNALIEKQVLVGYTSTANLMSILSRWDKTEIFDAIKKVRLLVVDDLGAERDTTYGAELIYSVIDARYRTGLPTIVTTNIDLNEMKSETDIWKKRIYDRVIEMCPIAIPMSGISKRGGIADERKEKARKMLL